MPKVKIAIEGCCHGELDAIYRLVSKDTELLIICGDFQAIRNRSDLQALKVPPKYLTTGDFPKYYLGAKKAPFLTIFIGGNHESLLYMHELQFGGWVAPNIYYLGEFGSVWFRGLKITGISGIYNKDSFNKALTPSAPDYTLPYNRETIATIYHVKPKNYLKLLLNGLSDIVLTHDWPHGVWKGGDIGQLLRHKPFFKDDIHSGKLGSPLAEKALNYLKPRYWFSLHLHTRFTASIKHRVDPVKRVKVDPLSTAPGSKNDDEIAFDMDDDFQDPDVQKKEKEVSTLAFESKEVADDVKEALETTEATQTPLSLAEKMQSKRRISEGEVKETFFLSLDKCLPRKRFLEHMQIDTKASSHPSQTSNLLFYDKRALAIQKVILNFTSSSQYYSLRPHNFTNEEALQNLLNELTEEVDREESKIDFDLEIPTNFTRLAPTINEEQRNLQYWPNPQTTELCKKIGIEEPEVIRSSNGENKAQE